MQDTLFTKIVRGDLPSWRVYEDDRVIGILDINPVNKGHVLVIPKEPYANVHDLPEELFAHLMVVAKRVSGAVQKATNADGINIIMNNGADAGQLIVNHAHVHIVPRFKDDGFKGWPSRHQYDEGEKEVVAEKIRGAISV